MCVCVCVSVHIQNGIIVKVDFNYLLYTTPLIPQINYQGINLASATHTKLA